MILSLVWLRIILELRRGWTSGEMHWFRRGGSEFSDDNNERVCRRDTEPVGFWALFVFYATLSGLIPAMIVVAAMKSE